MNNAGTELAVAIDSSDAAAFSTVLATNLEGERVPNGALTVFPGEGHYLDARHHPEMLEFLTGWR